MFNLFKKKKEESEEQQVRTNDSTVNADEFLDNVQEESSNEEVDTELSLNPSWKLDEEQIYVYRFMNNEHPPLKPNQISLGGFEMNKLENEVAVGAFVRSSLNKKIYLNNTIILLIDDEGAKLGRKEFDLSDLGELPGHSSRPHVFIFEEKDLFVPLEEVPNEGWKLAFEVKKPTQKHTLDLSENWEKSMASEEVESLQKFTNSLEPPKPGEINFLGLQATQSDKGDLHVNMLIRNGSDKTINLHELPLYVEDASGEIIARGAFDLEDFEVKANTSKPWTFIFPRAMIDKEEIDLSNWKAYPKQ